MIEGCGCFIDLYELLVFFFAQLCLGRKRLDRQLFAGEFCQFLNGFNEFYALKLGQKGDGVSALAAAKAIEYLFGLIYGKGRVRVGMERAEPCPVLAAFFQGDIAFNYLPDIDGVQYVLQDVIRNMMECHGEN